jgi:hypothetical protein
MGMVFRSESAASGARCTIKHGTGNGPGDAIDDAIDV